MSQTKKAKDDYFVASFGEQGEALPTSTVNGMIIGGVEMGGTTFERLPIGTSSGGTAVQVDLIGTESVVVQIGTVTVGTLNTLGTLSKMESGSIAIVAGTIGTVADTKLVHTVGTVAKLSSGSIAVIAGTIGTVADVKLVHAVGTINKLSTGSIAVIAGTVGTVADVKLVHTIGTLPNLPQGSINVTAGTIASVGTVPGLGSISNIAKIHDAGTINEISVLISGEDQTNDVLKTEEQFSYSYVAGVGADNVIKASAGFLHAIILGKWVTGGIVEVSDHASDGDGNVQIFLQGGATDESGFPKTILVDAKFTVGITADIAGFTNVTFIYR